MRTDSLDYRAEGKTGYATVSIYKPHPVHGWYGVVTTTNMTIVPKAPTAKGYNQYSTRLQQWFGTKEAAKAERKKQVKKLESHGWKRVKEYAGTKA